MKKIITEAIKQFTTVYHIEYGKGHVLSIAYRKDNNLITCYFPKTKTTAWIGETQLRSGMGDITLSKIAPSMQEEQIPDSLQSVLEGLFAPR